MTPAIRITRDERISPELMPVRTDRLCADRTFLQERPPGTKAEIENFQREVEALTESLESGNEAALPKMLVLRVSPHRVYVLKGLATLGAYKRVPRYGTAPAWCYRVQEGDLAHFRGFEPVKGTPA